MASESQAAPVYAAPGPPGEILLATDFCEPARRALDCARHIARMRGAAVRALHVMDLTGMPASEREHTSFSVARESAERMLREIRRELRLAGVRESAMLVAAGRPAQAIRETAEQHRPAMVVLGLNGSRSRRTYTLGATARALLTQAACPVLTVGAAAPDWDGCACRQPLFVTDTDPESLRAARAAWPETAEPETLPVRAVVAPNADSATQPELNGPLAEVRPLPLAGGAALALLHEAAERRTGLIVLALRGGGYLDSFASGSLAHALVTQAGCPVLTVRC